MFKEYIVYKVILYSITLIMVGFLASCSNIQTANNVPSTFAEPDIIADLEKVTNLAKSNLALEKGDKVDLKVYKNDPLGADSTLLAQATITYGEEEIHSKIKDLQETATDADYAVISTKGANSYSTPAFGIISKGMLKLSIRFMAN